MLKVKFTRCIYNSCVYIKEKGKFIAYTLLHLDDILVASDSITEIQNKKAILRD